MNEIEAVNKHPHSVQELQLLQVLKGAKDTAFGQQHHFADIHSIDIFQQRVPLQHYEDISPYIERMMAGEPNVLCAADIKWFAKSSGTTAAKSKFIPVSQEMLDICHYRGIKDVLTFYMNAFPKSKILSGKGLTLGGSHQVSPLSSNIFCGDLSAILIENTPFVGSFIRSPNKEVALIPNFEEKIARIAQETVSENIVQFAGVPSWNLVLMKYILDYTHKENLLQVWPHLELFIHGGISFVPYREQYQRIIPSKKMHYMETYNASEGFFALQNDLNDEGMLLMLDYGIFYEFVPMSVFGTPQAQAIPLADVQTGVNYAMLITTMDGLFRYVIGDTVEFTSLSPYKIKITGRTQHFINVFGEELMVHNADSALREACRAAGGSVEEYTVAPVFMSVGSKGRHEWLIEFESQPADIQRFAQELDQALCRVNSDYEAKRAAGSTLDTPLVRTLPRGTFYQWMTRRGKLGGQNKVPRLYNTREYAEQLTKL
ncbi:hypothetical protein AGMMS4956_04870 [Bacteroidia bacterium]|nr:hypothetical protein AGMMS4956_04870 [Bacteroidia bacterium]